MAKLKVDFELLKKQKMQLVELAASHTIKEESKIFLDGIISFLDSVDDEFEDTGEVELESSSPKKKVYNITYLDKDEEVIDCTQVDENDEDLIWQLFSEFGHEKTNGMHYEVEEVEDED